MSIEKPSVIEQKNELSLRRGSLLLGTGFVVLIGVVGLTYITAARSRSSFDEVSAAREIRTVAVDVRDGLLAAETSQRGFVLTGNEIYLAPYDTARSLALRRFERLQRLLAETLKGNSDKSLRGAATSAIGAAEVRTMTGCRSLEADCHTTK